MAFNPYYGYTPQYGRRHITVIKNGTLYDTFDCRNRRMWNAWKTN